jgi:hypothetical protein
VDTPYALNPPIREQRRAGHRDRVQACRCNPAALSLPGAGGWSRPYGPTRVEQCRCSTGTEAIAMGLKPHRFLLSPSTPALDIHKIQDRLCNDSTRYQTFSSRRYIWRVWVYR